MSYPPNVFISYARADGREYANHLYEALQGQGIKAWRDERNINPYQDFSAELERAIEAATHVAICITPDSKRDDSFVRREIGYALALKKSIIPLRFVDIPQHIQIINHTRIDFFANWDAGFEQLLHRMSITDPVYPKSSYPNSDPLKEYLETLYKQIVDFLDSTVFTLLTLHAESSLKSVAAPSHDVSYRALPMGFVGLHIKGEKQKKDESSFDSFPQAFEHFNEHVLLLGEPGAGKTTTVMAFAREVVARRLHQASAPLPLVAPISSWQAEKSQSFTEWLADIIALDQSIIESLLESSEALLLLDGLDELGEERIIFEQDLETGRNREKERFDPRKRFISMIEPYTKKNRILITCREREYSEIDQKIVLEGAIRLKPLTIDQMKEYLHDYPDLWSAIEADIALQNMASTPLLLSLLTYGYSKLGNRASELRNLQKSPDDLRDTIFETYVHRRYEHEQMRRNISLGFTIDEIYEILGYVATIDVTSYSNNDIDFYDIDHSLGELGFDDSLTSNFIELVTQLHLLTQIDVDSYRFLHLLIRDYFAFHSCMQQLQYDKENTYAILVLGVLQDNRALPILVDIVEEKDLDVDIRTAAIQALESIGNKSSTNVLLDVMQEEHSTIRLAAMEALIVINDAENLDAIIAVLSHSDRFVQTNAIESLRKFRDSRLIEPLMNYFEDPNLRNIVVKTLISLGDAYNKQFVKVVSERNSYIRSLVVKELGERYEVKLLEKFLNDKDARIRREAALELHSLNWQPSSLKQAATYYVAMTDWFECATLGDVALEPLLLTLKHTQDREVYFEIINTIAVIDNRTKTKSLAKKLGFRKEEIQKILRS